MRIGNKVRPLKAANDIEWTVVLELYCIGCEGTDAGGATGCHLGGSLQPRPPSPCPSRDAPGVRAHLANSSRICSRMPKPESLRIVRESTRILVPYPFTGGVGYITHIESLSYVIVIRATVHVVAREDTVDIRYRNIEHIS